MMAKMATQMEPTVGTRLSRRSALLALAGAVTLPLIVRAQDGDEAQDGAETPVADVEVQTGGLRAVSDGSPQEAPATIHERRRLMALIAAAGYKEQTVKELAALTLGERLLDRLSARQLGELERMVSAASNGAVDDATLAKRVQSATERAGGGEAVRRALDALARDGQQGDQRRAA